MSPKIVTPVTSGSEVKVFTTSPDTTSRVIHQRSLTVRLLANTTWCKVATGGQQGTPHRQ